MLQAQKNTEVDALDPLTLWHYTVLCSYSWLDLQRSINEKERVL